MNNITQLPAVGNSIWKIFPLRSESKGKDGQLVSSWPRDASNDPEQIASWTKLFPGCNWAVATGHASGIFVLDLDSEGAGRALEKLPGYQFLCTWTVKTGRGWHLYFLMPPNVDIRCPTVTPGIDIRGTGGYAVLPGSVHPNKTRYEILDPSVPIADAPEWLVQLVAAPERPLQPQSAMQPATADQIAHAGNILSKGCAELKSTKEGSRNNTLNRVAYNVAGLIASGCLPAESSWNAVGQAAFEAGLDEEEIRKTMASATKGMKRPFIPPTLQLPANLAEIVAKNQVFKVESGFPLPNQRRAVGRTGEEIPDEPTVWLFPNLIPRGHISVLAGEGGAGKSTLSLSFAAELTKRGSKVLIWSSEDIASQTIKPRLSAMGAIKANYTIVESTVNEMGVKQLFDPSTDLPLLEVMAEEMGGIDLLIVDSVLEVVPAKENPFIATVVRKAFQPLLMLIQKLNCGCIGILHFTKDSANKKPVDRIMNSRAFSDVARMNLAAAMDEETQECVFTRVKTNIAPLGGGYKYRLERMQWKNDKGEVIEAQYVQWGEEIQSSNPRAILAAVSYDPKKKDLPEGLPGTERLEAAKTWLLNLLTQEPVSIKALPSLTQNAGLNWSVVDCAKRILERNGKAKTGPIVYGGPHFLQIVV